METVNFKSLENKMKAHLRSLGYFHVEIQDDDTSDNSFDVIAEGSLRQMFIHVLVQIVTKQLNELSEEKIKSLKQEAKRQAKEAWTAIMTVDEQGKLVEDIQWTNLSKLTA